MEMVGRKIKRIDMQVNQLSHAELDNNKVSGVTRPAGKLFSLPEKLTRFGTKGALTRTSSYFIDKANQQGIFNGVSW